MTRKPALVTLLGGLVTLVAAIAHIVHHRTDGLTWPDIVLVIAGFVVLGAGAMALRTRAVRRHPTPASEEPVYVRR